VAVAGRLKGCLREADTAARLGGDEFIVVLEGVGGEGEALALSERIDRALAEPFSVWGTERPLKASIGTALNIRPHERPEELMRKADLAMYRSKKREGKDPPHPSRPPPDESAFS
jgi:diguanylate cyclase (GGDEF)-like protein